MYLYKVMWFGLKNAGATYQCLVNKMFFKQIEKNMKFYMDDMLVQSKKAHSYVQDLKETFSSLRKFNTKLDSLNACSLYNQGSSMAI